MGRISKIVIKDHFAFLAVAYQGLEIYDLTSPEYPVFFGSLEIPGPIHDLVIDVSTPEYPEILARVRIPGRVTDLEVIGDYLYAASGYNCGIQVLDVASPEDPVLLGVFNQPGSTVSLSRFRDNMIVATNFTNGLFTLPVNCPTSMGIDDPPGNGQLPNTPSLTPALTIHPNPFNPRTEISFSNERLQMVVVGIYDVKGRLVKMIANGIFDSGSHSFTWNGQDTQGKGLGSGTYFVRMETEERIWVEKVSLVR